ncbi:ABC transporter ATP-binding protein [Clostridiaceae bacterium UIB06]|uniref:ABC transporter ATP-binding protein n=1 Tax=Clostridium thailandense TaxID=2794346 RepID=A0A949TQQ2_9CLOT|nr:ABC transporter ATP-binding protein [Clostridium thailandense]MBV7274817.1 ABC transporter ATP-binding protein [Clostridium thailandense]MCH5137278.1 ABC transporter ATP-binding protein [Clostridiaceae bacterium UIB06]
MLLLNAKDLVIKFGGLTAVSDFNLTIKENELIGLIGPNGAGKTTVFNMLTGVYQPTSGHIEILEEKVIGLKPYELTKKHIARTFQNIRLFKQMTVLDNVKISFNYQGKYNFVEAILRLPKYYKKEKEMDDKARELLKVFGLESKEDELAMNLPYGEQRKLEIVRALAAEPKILLLDEPAAGMNPQETAELMNLINWIKDKFKISILLIEHDMKLVMGICERLIVLDHGQILAEGVPQEIKKNPKVIQAYLGEEVAV